MDHVTSSPCHTAIGRTIGGNWTCQGQTLPIVLTPYRETFSWYTLPLSREWGKVCSILEIRSVINACSSHFLFYYLENARPDLLSEDTDWERRDIFFHTSGSQGQCNLHIVEKGQIINLHEIQTAHKLLLKSWLLVKEPKATESKLLTCVLSAEVCGTECTCDHGDDQRKGCCSQQRGWGRIPTCAAWP